MNFLERITDHLLKNSRVFGCVRRLSGERWEGTRYHFAEEHIYPHRQGRKPIQPRKFLKEVMWFLPNMMRAWVEHAGT
jgi:hypothetical protein